MYCNYEQNDWANLLDTAAFVYNNTVHNSIGVSPFFACYGWNPKAHPDIPQRLGVNDPGRFEYLMDGKERCKYLQEQIREAQWRSVDQYNRKHKDIEFKPTMPPLPDEDLDFEVEALIDKRSHNGTTEYKVLWRGYSEEAASWEPVENLNCPDLIQDTEPICEEDQAQPRGGPSSKSRRSHEEDQAQMVTTQGLERQEVDTGHEEEEQCRRNRTEGSSPLRSGDHFKHQVNTLDTRVDATNLITNTINLIIIDATNLIINTINLIIIDITNLITNTINLIIINTHTRPWCHHNIDIDRAEPPLNGVSTEVSRNLR
ncbi:hypothetical protein NDA15_003764 [Ustilago hordei]|nr:hypothetical protein NDA15_003764 [Ustilago hordei]